MSDWIECNLRYSDRIEHEKASQERLKLFSHFQQNIEPKLFRRANEAKIELDSKQYRDWCAQQPEQIELQKALQQIIPNDFHHSLLNRPGILIELDDGSQYLIGDINPHGGTCGCCDAVSGSIVVRYKVIYER